MECWKYNPWELEKEQKNIVKIARDIEDINLCLYNSKKYLFHSNYSNLEDIRELKTLFNNMENICISLKKLHENLDDVQLIYIKADTYLEKICNQLPTNKR